MYARRSELLVDAEGIYRFVNCVNWMLVLYNNYSGMESWLSIHSRRHKLDPQKLCEKLGLVMYTYNFSIGEANSGGSLGFVGQLVLPNQWAPNSVRDLASKNKMCKLNWVDYLENQDKNLGGVRRKSEYIQIRFFIWNSHKNWWKHYIKKIRW